MALVADTPALATAVEVLSVPCAAANAAWYVFQTMQQMNGEVCISCAGNILFNASHAAHEDCTRKIPECQTLPS